MDQNDYWKIRAKQYDQLKWVQKKSLLNNLITFCDFNSQDIVMDAGCGTGVVAKAIADKVLKVAAMDNSEDMLSQLELDNPKIIPICADLQKPMYEFNDNFDKIVSRMVFHHIDNLEAGFHNCYNMLKEGGSFIIQEGIPPSETPEVVSWYSHVMAMKEKRHTFTESELKIRYFVGEFQNIETKIIEDKGFSVLNWLRMSGQENSVLKKIYLAHKNAPESIKKAYGLKIKEDGDILINTKVLLIKGTK